MERTFVASVGTNGGRALPLKKVKSCLIQLNVWQLLSTQHGEKEREASGKEKVDSKTLSLVTTDGF